MRELSLEVNGVRYPVRVHLESRASTRASIGKAGVTIRLPSALPAARRSLELARLMGWAERRLARIPVRRYSDGQEIVAGGRRWVIRIARSSGSRSSARVRGGEIRLAMSGSLEGSGAAAAAGAMVSRCLARECSSWLEERVAELNRLHFGVRVSRVALRNTSSTWGSCSPSGALSFSTRLLLAPPAIVDYVCVHELAHRLVPDHSASFWRQVRRALPDCEDRRRWLRRHGHELVW